MTWTLDASVHVFLPKNRSPSVAGLIDAPVIRKPAAAFGTFASTVYRGGTSATGP